MSRSIEFMVERVLGPLAHRVPQERVALAAEPPAYEAGAWECTCLIIGAHGDLARRLVADFPRFGVRPVLVTDTEAITRFVRTWRFDAILIDAREPDHARPILIRVLCGLAATPVMLLAQPAHERDVIIDIERGAADVMTPDASSRLIATKIKRLARIATESARSRGPVAAPPSTLQVGRLALDLRNERASVDGTPIDLPGRTFAVLAVLAQHVDTVIDRTTLSLQLGAGSAIRSRAFDMQISHLRAALARAGADDVTIDTVYRRGYRLAVRRVESADPAAV